MPKKCNTCGKRTSSLMKCQRCKTAAYCSAECQKEDWKQHKPTCQRKEFAGASCDCCGATENLDLGDMCVYCGHLYCQVCDEEHLTRDLNGYVVSFAPCPSCQQRRDCISRGDYKKLEKLIRERPNDPRLANWLVTLGCRVLDFDDTRKGEHKAEKYFLRAAQELGYGEGYSRLAEIYIKNRNWDEARRYYRLAAEQFHVIAIFNLACEAENGYFHFGSDFKFGTVVREDQRRPPDFEEAFHLYREGARLGHAGCCARLGRCYLKGVGIAVNPLKGFKQSKKAAEKGNAEGMKQCATCYRFGNGVEQSNEQAVFWFEKYFKLSELAADKDDADGMKHCATCYRFGNGVEQNNEQAVYWFEKYFKWSKMEAEKGDADGMKQCAICYQFGNGAKQSNEQAIYWYEKYLELVEDDEDARSDLQRLKADQSRGRCIVS